METSLQHEPQFTERFRKGDHSVFREVYNHFYKELFYFAVKMTGNIEQSEDIVSETMTKLWQRHQNFDTVQNIKAFLYITVRNTCLNFLASLKYQNKLKGSLPEIEIGEDSLFANMVKIEFLKQVRSEIESLPEKQKLVFKLFYLEDLTIEEIAKKLSISPNTVRGNKFQALEKLRAIFDTEKGLVAFMLTLAMLPTSYFFLIFF